VILRNVNAGALEVSALQAIVKWPFLARSLRPHNFEVSTFRLIFQHLSTGGTIFNIELRLRCVVTDYYIWDTDEADVTAVTELRSASMWQRRRELLQLALAACEDRDEATWSTRLAELYRAP
jgi:hypothetical protein